jgi:hypothetical protein
MELIAVDDGVRQWEQCATWVPQGPSATEIEVSAFDLAELDGRTVRFETLVSPELSRSTAELPLLAALADWGGCVDGDAVSIELPDQPCAVSGCALIDPEAYYCSGDWPVDPALRALYCDGFSMDWSTYLPTCEGGDGGDGGGDEGGDEGGDGGDDGEGPVELDCDGIDNDGDGVVDENNDHWTSYTFSRGVERAAIAGTIQATEGEWDPNTQLLRLSTRIQMSSGVNPSGLIVVLNPGDSPTGPGQAAQLFFDCNGGSPILTAYAYNGNDRYSYRDGSDRSGTQAPDPIWSSLADPSPLLEANCSLSGRDATLSFTLDAQAIQAHSPAYGSAASWSGVAFEAEYGIWMKILGNSTFRYSGDWLSSHTETKRAGIDRSNQITNPVAHCE